jgi:uncharacterized protein DUF559
MTNVVDLKPHSEAADRPGDHALAALAARQHGVVAHHQLLELGFGRSAIQYRLKVGRLKRLYRCVYAVGHTSIGSLGRLMAAVLACGPGAVTSHRSAGWLLGLKPPESRWVEVTAPGRTRGGAQGILLHQVRRLDGGDRGERDGIPITSLPRTLLDLAEVLRPRQLERAIEEAERLRLFDLAAIEDLCLRSPGRRGVRRLRAVLAEPETEAALTRSELERRFLDLCRDAGVPTPAVNTVVMGFEVDAVWPDRQLVVELDGYAFHQGRVAFERDRVRDSVLQLAGFRVIRVTHRRLETEPGVVAETLRSLLGMAGRPSR